MILAVGSAGILGFGDRRRARLVLKTPNETKTMKSRISQDNANHSCDNLDKALRISARATAEIPQMTEAIKNDSRQSRSEDKLCTNSRYAPKAAIGTTTKIMGIALPDRISCSGQP
jgi:hypothetical protein